MRNYIIISKEQADRVRGRHGKYSALVPVQFPDGTFGIPERVLDDKEFSDIHDILKKYREHCEIQDIKDLPEEGEIERGKFYLSKHYGVVKVLETKRLVKGIDIAEDVNIIMRSRTKTV